MIRLRRLPGVVLTLMATACGSGADGPVGPTPPSGPPDQPVVGAISIQVSTVGAATDPDGYSVLLDSALAGTVTPQGVLVLRDVPAGHHSVALAGVAPGCDRHAGDPVDVGVRGGATTVASFSVPCAGLATVRVITHTSGSQPDPDGYSVIVGGMNRQAIGIEDTVEIPDVPAGIQRIVLGGLAANCGVQPLERQINLLPGRTADVVFEVGCLPPGPGTIDVSVYTSAILVPSELTFSVELDGGNRLTVGSHGTVTYTGVAPGPHSIKLLLPGYCGVGLFGSPGSNPTTIDLRPSERRLVEFHVLCLG